MNCQVMSTYPQEGARVSVLPHGAEERGRGKVGVLTMPSDSVAIALNAATLRSRQALLTPADYVISEVIGGLRG